MLTGELAVLVSALSKASWPRKHVDEVLTRFRQSYFGSLAINSFALSHENIVSIPCLVIAVR